MDKDTALRLALEALEEMQNAIYNIGGEHVIDLNFAIERADVSEEAIAAIKAALEAKDEPVAWTLLLVGEHHGIIGKPGDAFASAPAHYRRVDVYTTPPQRKPLTDEQIGDEFVRFQVGGMFTPFLYAVRAIEAAHGIKGEA